ncbi:MAG TPA: hypothetical protein VH480_25800 [Streptosporangiaceae bacterium]
MTRSSHPARAGDRAAARAWGRADRVLFALAVLTLVLIAAQFALAGFGAFTMEKTPTDNAPPACWSWWAWACSPCPAGCGTGTQAPSR